MRNDEEVNWNDENLGNMAEELQKRREKVTLLQKEKKAGAAVTPPVLPVSNDPVLYDNILIFILIFTF